MLGQGAALRCSRYALFCRLAPPTPLPTPPTSPRPLSHRPLPHPLFAQCGRRYDEDSLQASGLSEAWQKRILRKANKGRIE